MMMMCALLLYGRFIFSAACHPPQQNARQPGCLSWVPGCSRLLYDCTYIPVLSLTSNTMVRPFLACSLPKISPFFFYC